MQSKLLRQGLPGKPNYHSIACKTHQLQAGGAFRMPGPNINLLLLHVSYNKFNYVLPILLAHG